MFNAPHPHPLLHAHSPLSMPVPRAAADERALLLLLLLLMMRCCCPVLQEVAAECGISAMPTFQVFKGGKKIGEMVGANKDKLVEMIQQYTSAKVAA